MSSIHTTFNNFTIIGAGGVASYLLGPLLRTFDPESVDIFDKDILEERNLDRQLFRPKDVGQNKAEALKRMHGTTETHVTAYKEWFESSGQLSNTENAILLSCADNHRARCAVMRASDDLGIPSIIGGNEYFDSEAWLYLPEWKGTHKDMRHRHPNMLIDTRGSPLHCQEEQETHPQLAMANMDCAVKMLKLIWIYKQWLENNKEGLLQYRLFTSLYENKNEHIRTI